MLVTKSANVGAYIQDEVALQDNFTMVYGVRFDMPYFTNEGYKNTEVDNFGFVDEDNNAIKLSTSETAFRQVDDLTKMGFQL